MVGLASRQATEEEKEFAGVSKMGSSFSFLPPLFQKMVALVLFGLGAPPKALAMAEKEQSHCERAWQLRRQA